MKEDESGENEEKPKESSVEGTENSTTTDKKTDDNQGGGKKSATRHAESRYAAVPMNQMFCHVCNKHMWDGFVSQQTKKFPHQQNPLFLIINLIETLNHFSPSRITCVVVRIN